MMGNVPGWLIGLACLVMVALMCLPVVIGMIRRRRRRGAGVPAGSAAPGPAAGPSEAGRSDGDPPDAAASGLG
jgi:hypothetical protein